MFPGMGGAVGDLESGKNNGYPQPNIMAENPQFRWAFIRKVYCILSMQFILTVAVAAVVVFVPRVAYFLRFTIPGLAIYIVSIILSFITLCLLACFHKHHPLNFILLTVFTLGMSLGLGMTCAFTKGMIVLEAAILTAVVVVSLTLFTFWGAKRGMDFRFLEPFLFCSLMLLLAFGLLQVFLPMGNMAHAIYGALGALIFSGFLIYDTDNIIKRFDYDEYIWASVNLYLDIMNIFSFLLTALTALDD